MTNTTVNSSRSLSRSETLVAAVFAILLGTFLVYGAGFANANALHEAAHDTRHAFSFPCH
ncbi:MAG TPA: CbtB domain-containing protein [Azospirillum sp.]|nr:CbtB domain-containing protein [Azospirillum sp.]